MTNPKPQPGNILVSISDGQAEAWVEGTPAAINLDRELIMALLEDSLSELYEQNPERQRPCESPTTAKPDAS